MPLQRLELGYSEKVVAQEVFYSQDNWAADCELSRQLPMLVSSLENENISCAGRIQYDAQDQDELRHFEATDEEKPIERRRKKKSFWERLFGN